MPSHSHQGRELRLHVLPIWPHVGAVGELPMFRSCDTAVTSCAGASGLVSMMLFGTPFDAQDWACAPLM
jgi:hypothetical protein